MFLKINWLGIFIPDHISYIPTLRNLNSEFYIKNPQFHTLSTAVLWNYQITKYKTSSLKSVWSLSQILSSYYD